MRFAFLLVALVACSFDDTSEVERPIPPCAELKAHLIDLRLEMATGTPDQLIQHRQAMERALGDDFVASCEKNMNPAQITCALFAAGLQAAMACAAQPEATP